MIYLIVLPIVFVYTSILWVIVITVYNLVLEPFDFGPLGSFAAKSFALIFVVSLVVTFMPLGALASLVVWWIGLMLIFKKDFWECKILVIMIWFVNFLTNLGVTALVASFARSPVSTV